MNNIFSKFNLYDQIGYLLVGAIALILIIFDSFYFYSLTIPEFKLDALLVWFIVAYFFGHVVQTAANLLNEIPLLNFLIRENKKEFTDKEKEILEQAKIFFKLKKQDEDKIWNLCYVFALAKDISGHVQIFNAYYSLYRGWFIIFLLQSIFLSIYVLFVAYNLQIILLLITSIFIACLFHNRSLRFWQYTRNKALETFVVVKTLNL
ncbi:MAG: hypothetical protein PHV63_01145 [Candidatus Daviesbacteria bacterium]|nr:hypothetical protein [Candidatus Daviesbacteria bacterium]